MKKIKKGDLDIYEGEDRTIIDARTNKSTTPTIAVETEMVNGRIRARMVCLICKFKTSWTPSNFWRDQGHFQKFIQERKEFGDHYCKVKGDERRV